MGSNNIIDIISLIKDILHLKVGDLFYYSLIRVNCTVLNRFESIQINSMHQLNKKFKTELLHTNKLIIIPTCVAVGIVLLY